MARKKKTFNFFPEHPCKVCGRMIPEHITYCSSKCSRIDKEREKKVNMAISMTDAVTQICAEGIKDNDETLTDKEVQMKLRERFIRGKDINSK